MRLNHHRAGQLLSPYLDGELLAAESRAVQEHLLECAACRQEYERLRATRALLSELPVAEPPAEFWAAVRAPRAPRPLPLAARFAGPGWRPGWWPRAAWAVAAAVLVLALALTPLIKGTVDRLHAAEIGVDLYVREHALQMGTEPLTDRAYLGLVAGDADLVLVGERDRARGTAP
jgi:anti-sigma factor RsiW